MEHPAYSPDLAPSDFHLFRLLKALRGRRYDDDDDVKAAVHLWLRAQPKTFFLMASKSGRKLGKMHRKAG
jgi:histone-lysine N-methyltransferase SETMAR